MEHTSYTNEFREKIQEEAESTLLSFKRATANITMRLGKTKIGLNIASKFKKVIVSYPNISILDSWKKDAETFRINIDHITFTTHRSLKKHNLQEYDCLIIDEIHDLSENQWMDLQSDIPNKLYGLTGTPPIKGEKAEYLNRLCPVKYVKKLEDTTGITNKDYEIRIHLLKPSTKRDLQLKSGKLWSEANKIQFFDNLYEEKRTLTVMLQLINSIKTSRTKFSYLRKLIAQKRRCIVFVENTEQCKETNLLSYHSKEKDSEKNLDDFQNNRINKLVTINQLRQGTTFHDLQSCIILHSYASNNRTSQKIGRCLNYVEGEKAIIDIICLKGTRDEMWTKQALVDFDNNKIKYIDVEI